MAIDDTLFRQRGKKVWAAGWFHDGSAAGPAKTGYGNNWVIAAVIVRLPVVSRPVAVPVLAKLVIKGTSSASRLWLARRMTQMIARALPGRPVHVVADAAYVGEELKKLPAGITWTTRLRKDAALYDLPPERTASSSPPDLRHLTPTSQHPKKSTSSAWPGKTQRHNRESRVLTGGLRPRPRRQLAG